MSKKFFSFTLLFLLSLVSLVTLPLSEAQNGAVVTTEGLWCVAKNNAEDAALQSALDWACGLGGADCGPIQQGGPCYDPSDIQRTASFAFNDYYLKHGLTDDACSFDNTASLTSLNPSYGSCKFPSSSTVNNGSFSGSTIPVGMGPGFADMSGCDQSAGTWFWPFVFVHFFFIITRFYS